MRIATALASLLCAACATSGTDTDDGAFVGELSSADATRVLDLVNYPGTDRALLDGPVGLDARAAGAITARRNGGDGVSPSADDQPFATLADLDAVSFVG